MTLLGTVFSCDMFTAHLHITTITNSLKYARHHKAAWDSSFFEEFIEGCFTALRTTHNICSALHLRSAFNLYSIQFAVMNK